MSDKFIKKYFEYPDGRKEWCVTGDSGSVSFWVQELSSEFAKSWGEKYFGGIEYHYNENSKPEYLSDVAHHKNCIQNGGVCWHDGTSLWASEHWIPNVLPAGQDCIWRELEHTYKTIMNKDEEEAA